MQTRTETHTWPAAAQALLYDTLSFSDGMLETWRDSSDRPLHEKSAQMTVRSLYNAHPKFYFRSLTLSEKSDPTSIALEGLVFEVSASQHRPLQKSLSGLLSRSELVWPPRRTVRGDP